jgi:hypothetical protein
MIINCDREEITPYLHVFIYNIRFYMEQYGGLNKYSNYAQEGMHLTNKKILTRMTVQVQHCWGNKTAANWKKG